jgi:hypothetical protein
MGFLRKGMSRRQLGREGTRAEAEIIEIRYTNTNNTHGPIFAVKLVVRPPSGEPFETDGKINASIPNPPVPGQVIPIIYDPEHPSSLMWDEDAGKREDQEAVEARRREAFERAGGSEEG